MMFRKMLATALVLSLTLCGCFAPRRDKNTYVFWNSDSQITTIEILKKTEDTGSENDPTEVVFVLPEQEHDAFLEKLSALPGEHQSIDPGRGFGAYIVRITYGNGVIALIGYTNTEYHFPDGDRKHYYFFFHRDSFYEMIDEILNMDIES